MLPRPTPLKREVCRMTLKCALCALPALVPGHFRQTVRAFGSALDAFMVRVKELDGVLLQLIKVIGDGMAPPEQLSRFQRLIVDAGALAKVPVCTVQACALPTHPHAVDPTQPPHTTVSDT